MAGFVKMSRKAHKDGTVTFTTLNTTLNLSSPEGPEPDQAEERVNKNSWVYKQWSSADGKSFFPIAKTYEKLIPDVYEPKQIENQIFFYKVNFSTEDLITFDDSAIDKVVSEIQKFWNSKEKFKKFGFPYKRGILLYGVAGSGKSCAIKLIIQQVIKMGGIGLRFDHPPTFINCTRVLRQIQPDVPIVVIMEDLDAIIHQYNESYILNMLDGIDGFENIVYLATTNYPEELEGRIVNRPSRFDKRFHIGYPNEKSREIYFEFLQKKHHEGKIENIDRWIKDTKNFTFAHMKELFISVKLFDTPYEDAIKEITKMRDKISSEDDNNSGVGFMR